MLASIFLARSSQSIIRPLGSYKVKKIAQGTYVFGRPGVRRNNSIFKNKKQLVHVRRSEPHWRNAARKFVWVSRMNKFTLARKRTGAVTAEFTAALAIFLLLMLFPIINLIGMAMAAGTQYLLTVECASRAGNAATFEDALTAMERTSTEITTSGFGKFGKLQPIAGYSGSGTNLFINVTRLNNGGTLVYGPNVPYAGIIDKSNRVYEYQVRSTFNVGPFVNLSMFPFINDVPGVGKPARLQFVANRTVEFADGLAMGGNGTVLASGGRGGSGGGYPLGGGSGGGGTLPASVVFNTVVPGNGDGGSYLITIYGGRSNGGLTFSMTGGYSNLSSEALISTTQTFNANGQNMAEQGMYTNPGTDFQADGITSQGSGTDANWSVYDMAMDGILMNQIADPGSVAPGEFVYWDSAGNWHTDGQALFNPYNASPAQAAAMAQAWGNFLAWYTP